MASQFSERLDFLMSLTNTTNSALARELSFDASYISRIRNGKRGVPLHQPFIEPAATYLASRVRESYQVQTVEQALHASGGWPTSPDEQARLIAGWLTDNTATLDARFNRLFDSLTNLSQRVDNIVSSEPGAVPKVEHASSERATTRYFFGDQGKRDAIELFLTELIATGEPQTLLAYSDENLDWLSEDHTFARRWLALLMQFIAAGGTITVVHTITRDIGEMLDAVQKWLPLYLTGRIESYYCPRIRDGICRRTLFVARGCAALTSNSIEEKASEMASALVTERDVVGAHEREFNNLLALCRPLVRVTPLSDELSDERENATFIAANPGAANRAMGLSLPIIQTTRLPKDVIAFINENTGFTLAHLTGPSIAMHVTERLLTAAFMEYLRQ